jgi:hypothetical protein
MDVYYMKLQFHGSCLLAAQSCRFIAFLEHEAAVSLLSGSTKLQFHYFLATRNCSFVDSYYTSCSFMNRASCSFMAFSVMVLWQHETAVPILSGNTQLKFHG